MTERAFLVAFLYMVFSFGLGILVGKSIRWGRTGTTEYRGEDCDGC